MESKDKTHHRAAANLPINGVGKIVVAKQPDGTKRRTSPTR